MVADGGPMKAKHDIVLLGRLDDGLGFYRFVYNGGHTAYVGVMAQEVQASGRGGRARPDGYLRVFYDKLGLKFQTYDEWIASGARLPTAPWSRTDCLDHDAVTRCITVRCMSNDPKRMSDISRQRQRHWSVDRGVLFATASVALAQQDYKTPQDAVDALVATARSGDQKAALVVLGHGGEDIISSGDKVSDDAVRQRFVTSYDAKHRLRWRATARRSW